jgi:hypothetical protein
MLRPGPCFETRAVAKGDGALLGMRNGACPHGIALATDIASTRISRKSGYRFSEKDMRHEGI